MHLLPLSKGISLENDESRSAKSSPSISLKVCIMNFASTLFCSMIIRRSVIPVESSISSSSFIEQQKIFRAKIVSKRSQRFYENSNMGSTRRNRRCLKRFNYAWNLLEVTRSCTRTLTATKFLVNYGVKGQEFMTCSRGEWLWTSFNFLKSWKPGRGDDSRFKNRTIYQEYIRYQLKEISIDVVRVLVLIPVSELHLISRQHVCSLGFFSEFRHGEIQAEEKKKRTSWNFFLFFVLSERRSFVELN